MTREQKRQRLINIVTENPGLSGEELKTRGWSPSAHGSLLDAERRGDITWRGNASGGGWYPNPPTA